MPTKLPKWILPASIVGIGLIILAVVLARQKKAAKKAVKPAAPPTGKTNGSSNQPAIPSQPSAPQLPSAPSTSPTTTESCNACTYVIADRKRYANIDESLKTEAVDGIFVLPDYASTAFEPPVVLDTTVSKYLANVPEDHREAVKRQMFGFARNFDKMVTWAPNYPGTKSITIPYTIRYVDAFFSMVGQQYDILRPSAGRPFLWHPGPDTVEDMQRAYCEHNMDALICQYAVPPGMILPSMGDQYRDWFLNEYFYDDIQNMTRGAIDPASAETESGVYRYTKSMRRAVQPNSKGEPGVVYLKNAEQWGDRLTPSAQLHLESEGIWAMIAEPFMWAWLNPSISTIFKFNRLNSYFQEWTRTNGMLNPIKTPGVPWDLISIWNETGKPTGAGFLSNFGSYVPSLTAEQKALMESYGK